MICCWLPTPPPFDDRLLVAVEIKSGGYKKDGRSLFNKYKYISFRLSLFRQFDDWTLPKCRLFEFLPHLMPYYRMLAVSQLSSPDIRMVYFHSLHFVGLFSGELYVKLGEVPLAFPEVLLTLSLLRF